MSTRVHELAKELGLKGPELVERIQKWNLDVKPSVLASLDPAMVDRIRGLARGAGGAVAKTTSPRAEPTPPKPAPAPAPSTSPSPVSSTLPKADSGSSSIAPATTSKPATATASSPSVSGPGAAAKGSTSSHSSGPNATRTPTSSETTAIRSSTPTAPSPARPATAPSSASSASPAHAPAASGSGSPATRPHQPATLATPPVSGLAAPPRSAGGLERPPAPAPGTSPAPATGSGPLAGHGRGPNAGARSAGGGPGPLSGHTHHRHGGAPAPGTRAGGGAGPSDAGPLRATDYITPAGTRYASPGPPATIPSQPRRSPVAESTPGGGSNGGGSNGGGSTSGSGNAQGDGSRRSAGGSGGGGTRRPLPQVATQVNSPPPRRSEAPRPAGPESKTQRPDVKFTPDQIRAMMQAGQLKSGSTPPPAPGRRPSGDGHGPRRNDSGAMIPGSRPAARRPPIGPPTSPSQTPPPQAAPLVTPPTESEEEDEKNKQKHGRLFSQSDRANRRSKRAERATERKAISSPVPAAALLEVEEDARRTRRGPHRHNKPGHRHVIAPSRKTHADIEFPITLRGLSEATGVPANEFQKKLFTLGHMLTINSNIDEEVALELTLEFGIEITAVRERTAEDELLESIDREETETELLELRPPIITILGHVDHGKTSLLDRIRKSNVVSTESGGITQHIGAYQVEHDGKAITFVDTPGHEAFTAMRARGANVTDIVVLVVAADDGVMPQTEEAIAHARAADVPIVVALNKIDLPGANINKIYGELSRQDLMPPEYGGSTEVVKTSALTGQGIPELLETLLLIAEDKNLRSNPNRSAVGTCLESSISEGRGVIATVLVQDGTLKVGDVVVCGDGYGRVRAIFDDKGRSILAAGPSTPVEVSGLDAVPTAGERFAAVEDIVRAREIAETRRLRTRGAALGEHQTITLENLYTRMAEQKLKSLNLILKADVQGSLEALVKELAKLENPEVPIRILLKAVGGISESDILLADASQAVVIGFRVAPEDRAVTLAEEKKIDIRRYDIIYQVTDEIKKAIEGMLVPELKEVHLGRAVVRQAFKISKVGTVAGCFVTQGSIERNAKVRIIREGREVYKGALEALKRFKDDAREVAQNFECGIKVANFDDVKVDDVIEAYRIEVIKRTL